MARLCEHGPSAHPLAELKKLLSGAIVTCASLKVWLVDVSLAAVDSLMHRGIHNCWAVSCNCIGQYVMLHLP